MVCHSKLYHIYFENGGKQIKPELIISELELCIKFFFLCNDLMVAAEDKDTGCTLKFDPNTGIAHSVHRVIQSADEFLNHLNMTDRASAKIFISGRTQSFDNTTKNIIYIKPSVKSIEGLIKIHSKLPWRQTTILDNNFIYAVQQESFEGEDHFTYNLDGHKIFGIETINNILFVSTSYINKYYLLLFLLVKEYPQKIRLQLIKSFSIEKLEARCSYWCPSQVYL